MTKPVMKGRLGTLKKKMQWLPIPVLRIPVNACNRLALLARLPAQLLPANHGLHLRQIRRHILHRLVFTLFGAVSYTIRRNV